MAILSDEIKGKLLKKKRVAHGKDATRGVSVVGGRIFTGFLTFVQMFGVLSGTPMFAQTVEDEENDNVSQFELNIDDLEENRVATVSSQQVIVDKNTDLSQFCDKHFVQVIMDQMDGAEFTIANMMKQDSELVFTQEDLDQITDLKGSLNLLFWSGNISVEGHLEEDELAAFNEVVTRNFITSDIRYVETEGIDLLTKDTINTDSDEIRDIVDIAYANIIVDDSDASSNGCTWYDGSITPEQTADMIEELDDKNPIFNTFGPGFSKYTWDEEKSPELIFEMLSHIDSIDRGRLTFDKIFTYYIYKEHPELIEELKGKGNLQFKCQYIEEINDDRTMTKYMMVDLEMIEECLSRYGKLDAYGINMGEVRDEILGERHVEEANEYIQSQDIGFTPEIEIIAPNDPGKMLFTDLDESDWEYPYVKEAWEDGMIDGYEDNTFRSENVLTYAAWLKLLLKGAGYEFDVAETGHWFGDGDGMLYAKMLGLIEEGEVMDDAKLDSPIPRERAAVMAVITVEYITGNEMEEGELTFADTNDIQQEYKDEVAKTVAAEIINGYPDNTFKANENLTRAEGAKVLIKVMDEML